MKITDDIFKSYLSCQYKAYLKLCGKTGNKTELEKLNDEFRKVLEIKLTQQFLNEYNSADILQSPLLKISDLKKGKKVILTPHLEIENISTSLFALEKLSNPSKLGSFSYVSILLSENKKITKAIRLLLTFQAVCLEKNTGKHARDWKNYPSWIKKKKHHKIGSLLS